MAKYFFPSDSRNNKQQEKGELQDALTSSKLCIEVPDKKALMRAKASLGLCKGTSCPAPRTDTKVSPTYS